MALGVLARLRICMNETPPEFRRLLRSPLTTKKLFLETFHIGLQMFYLLS